MLVDLASANLEQERAAVRQWLRDEEVHVLNVAGPRESSASGIAAEAADFLRALLQEEDPSR